MASRRFYSALRQIKQWTAGLQGNEFNLETLRRTMNTSMMPVPETARLSRTEAGGVPCEWLRDPRGDSDRRLLYLHGGGYVAGGLASHRPLAAWIAGASGCSVLLADYRLAPEHVFPAAVEDALACFRWMAEHGPEAKGSAVKTVIAGDSAGGGLTLATLMALREAGDELPAASVTLSAWTDLALTGGSLESKAGVDPVVSPGMMRGLAAAYLGEADPRTSLASPLYGDLTGLPPLLIQVGEAEVLLDDSIRLAQRARNAGVQVSLEVWPEMFHVWQGFAPLFPEGQQAIDRIGEFVRSFSL
ncbi:MAG: alpha/beta hydrolase [Syntrophobacteria bacterium]